jgi:hypothetical protein
VPAPNGSTFWADVVDWCLWWLSYTVGAFAVRQRRIGALKALMAARSGSRYGGAEPMVQSVPGNTGHELGISVMATMGDQQWLAPAFESLRRDLSASELLRERYPEFVRGENEPLYSLAAFDFIVSIGLGLTGCRAAAHWTMYSEGAKLFARRLHGDARLREVLAQALGVELTEFDERAPGALAAARAQGQFGGDRDAITILQTGTR